MVWKLLFLCLPWLLVWIQPLSWRSQLAYRTGKPFCWVQFFLPHQERLCISQQNWLSWLRQPEADWGDLLPVTGSQSPTILSTQTLPEATQWVTRSVALVHLPTVPWIRRSIKCLETLREKLSIDIRQQAQGSPLFLSLLLNEGTQDPRLGLWRKLGFVHLASVSGIHLATLSHLIASFFQALTTFFKLPPHLGWQGAQGINLGCFFLLWCLAGGRFGMLRPWLILYLKDSAWIAGLRWQRGLPLFLAFSLEILTIFFHTPHGYSDRSLGRWIYFLATAGCLFWLPLFPQKKWTLHVGMALCSWLGVACFEICHEGTIALATPLISLVCLPLVCSLLYPGLLLALIAQLSSCELLLPPLWKGLCHMTQGLLDPLTWLACQAGNLWVITRSDWLIGLTGSVFLWILVPKVFFLRNLKGVLLTLGLTLICRWGLERSAYFSGKTTPKAYQVSQLNVGQGDAALITGPTQGLFDTGSQRALKPIEWIKLFAAQRLTQLDWVAFSHLDEDHRGGFEWLQHLLPIGCVTFPDDLQGAPSGERWKAHHPWIQIAPWEGPACLPVPHFQTRGAWKKRNHLMGGLLVPLSEGFYANAGDLGISHEAQWIEWIGNRPVSILKIAHHGSKTSTGERILQALHPSLAWISSGKKNSYGHPHPIVLKRLEAASIRVQWTATEGLLRSPSLF